MGTLFRAKNPGILGLQPEGRAPHCTMYAGDEANPKARKREPRPSGRGNLFLVSTPIGNLGDITLRALEILKSVDLIVCEDTRVFGKLAKAYQIEKRLVPINDFNEQARVSQVLGELTGGRDVALVSDAGTPLISDPGYKLVREAINRGIKIESIPGPSAVIAALTVSGKPPDKFLFLGYLPKKQGRRKQILANVSSMVQTIKLTIIIYESPYRLHETLTDVKEVFGDTEIVVCRELTKMHEEVRREKVSDSIGHFSQIIPKGEFTILI